MVEKVERKEKGIAEEAIVIKEVLDHVLYTGLFGVLDSNRMTAFTERMMEEITRRDADVVVMDLGGIKAVDTAIADRLSKLIATAKLLGASIILCGVTPEVAQTMVQTGVNITVQYTFRNLKTALQQSYRMKGLELMPIKNEEAEST